MGHLQHGFIRQWGSSELATSYIPSYKDGIKLSFWGWWLYCAPSSPTLSNSMERGAWRAAVHRIFQARVLERAAVSFCRRSLPSRLLRLLHYWEMLAKHESHIRMDSFVSGPDFWHGKLPVLIFLPETELDSSGSTCLAGQNFCWGLTLLVFIGSEQDSWAACGRRPLVVTYGWDRTCKGLVNTARFLLRSEAPMTGTENW